MNATKLIALALLSGASSGCMFHSSMAWLESGKIDMRKYQHEPVLMLPVESAPSVRLSDAERSSILKQVRANLARVYDLDLDKLVTPAKVNRLRLYPYQRDELVYLGKAHNVAAVAAVSIFSLTRTNSLQPDSKAQTLGMSILFTDSMDPLKSWSMTREYHSDRGFGAGSDRFDTTVRYDLEAAKPTINAGQGFFGVMKNVFTLNWRQNLTPRVVVTLRPDDTLEGATMKRGGMFQFLKSSPPPPDVAAEIDPARLQDTKVTEQSRMAFQLVAADVSGLVRTEVANKAASFNTTVSHQLDGAKSKEGAFNRIEEIVYVPLAAGVNDVDFVTYNQLGKSTTTRLSITRKPAASVYALGIGIDHYRDLGTESHVPVDELKERFARVRQRWPGDTLFLANQEATQREVERSLYDLGKRINTNELGLGLFYFTGKVRAGKAGIYLMAYDSEQKFAEVTGVSGETLRRTLPKENSKAILDLCEPDPAVRERVTMELPNALVSFDSCAAGETKIASQVATIVDSGRTLPEAIADVSAQQQQTATATASP